MTKLYSITNNKKIKGLANLDYANVRVLVDINDYTIGDDPRLLIPFSYYQYYGLMNRNAEVVVDPKFDRILDSCRHESDVVRVGIHYTCGFNRTAEPATYLRTKWGLVDSKGNFILEPAYKGIGVSTDNRILTLQHMDGQYEVIDIDGKVIVPKGKYSWIDSFDNGLARVNHYDGENKRYGIIDDAGNEVLPLVYSNIWNFFNKNREWITIEAIDEHGNKRVDQFNLLTREATIPYAEQ